MLQDTSAPLGETEPLVTTVSNASKTTTTMTTTTRYDAVGTVDDTSSQSSTQQVLSLWRISCILSTAFGYGCIMTTLFLITLPLECQRIPTVSASIALGLFVALAGLTQLVSPLVGRISDTYQPTAAAAAPPYQQRHYGQRLPYHVVGSVLAVIGLVGQTVASQAASNKSDSSQTLLFVWLGYSVAFGSTMVGLNVMYAIMLALLADQIPPAQMGVANGVLAMQVVTGSLTGFALFHTLLRESVENMYGLYLVLLVIVAILTSRYGQPDTVTAHTATTTTSACTSAATGAAVSPTMSKISYAQFLADLWQPVRQLDWQSARQAYTIDTSVHYDFFIVTLSRLFYYCGSSVQTFFLYFLRDVIHVSDARAPLIVAQLALWGQCSGAIVCYPAGLVSDRCWHGQRRPLVYVSCLLLAGATLCIVWARSIDDMMVLCTVLGVGNGIYLTMETSLAVDTLNREAAAIEMSEPPNNGQIEEQLEGQHKRRQQQHQYNPPHHRQQHAQLLGIWGVAAFVGSAVGPLVGGPLLYWVGHATTTTKSSGNEDTYGWAGYAVVLSLSAFYFACSAGVLRFLKGRE